LGSCIHYDKERLMSSAIPGLHHITAVAGSAQANLDFYVGTLGQHLVKKTVNFDDPSTYHLYYGNRVGSPGTILTFFPFADAGLGRSGVGMASAFAYAVPKGGLDAWLGHLRERGVEVEEPVMRLGERMLSVRDPDGLRIELIETDIAVTPGDPIEGTVESGFHSVTLWLRDFAPTARVLTEIFGYVEEGHESGGGEGASLERLRFRSPRGERGSIVDLVRTAVQSTGRPAAGTIHHVAFRAQTDEIQREWRDRVKAAGLDITPVIDRQYFNAIYFREPGGILFEIATDPPGFAVDEKSGELGTALKLPAKYEAHRTEIERILPQIRTPSTVGGQP
jgi:glyoxalase family protein